MLTANEMNKKLAEWAGFKLISGVPVPYYQNPNGQAVTRSGDMPNFPQSLDACFKWLKPTVISKGTPTSSILTWRTILHNWLKSIAVEKAMDDAPALALCLAILELEEAKC